MEDLRNKLIAKVAVCFSFAFIVFIGFLIAPKRIMKNDDLYNTTCSLASTEDENTVFYDYKVYVDERRFDSGLKNDVPVVLEKFKEADDILLVKIPGEEKTTELKDGYWLIKDSTVPELNIEYYVLKNIDFANNSIPSHTFLTLAKNILKKANTILALVVVLVFIFLETILIIFGSFNARKLKQLNNSNYR